jgi:hypothetical protein
MSVYFLIHSIQQTDYENSNEYVDDLMLASNHVCQRGWSATEVYYFAKN